MTDMARTRVQIDYPSGGPGLNTFYWTSGFPAGPIDVELVNAFHAEIAALYTSIDAFLVDSATFTVLDLVDILDPETGNITNQVAADDPPAPVPGDSSALAISRGECIVANLLTGTWVDGSALRGKHFLGPIGSDVLDANGEMNSGSKAAIVDAYTAITTGVGPRLAVWHRPNPPSSGTGYYADVSTVAIATKPGFLKSRRA